MNEKELNIYSKKKKEFLSFLNKKPLKGLYDPINYIFNSEGKNIRPFFIILIYKFYSGRSSSINSVALAVQALHNFTLIHDDIMDDSQLRRGGLTVHRKWDINTAILSGDALMIYCYQILSSVKFKKKEKLFNFFTKTAIQVCEGQQLDIDFQKKEKVEIKDYLNMINLKTGALFAFSFSVGPLLLDRDKDEKKMYDLGILLGQLFQIQDDYLDLFGDEKLIGKKIGGDVIKRKKTVMYHVYKDISSSEDSRFLDQIYDDNKLEDLTKVEKITSLYKDKEVNIKTRKLSQEYSSKAISLIEKLNIKNDNKTGLIDICNKLLSRDY